MFFSLFKISIPQLSSYLVLLMQMNLACISESDVPVCLYYILLFLIIIHSCSVEVKASSADLLSSLASIVHSIDNSAAKRATVRAYAVRWTPALLCG